MMIFYEVAAAVAGCVLSVSDGAAGATIMLVDGGEKFGRGRGAALASIEKDASDVGS